MSKWFWASLSTSLLLSIRWTLPLKSGQLSRCAFSSQGTDLQELKSYGLYLLWEIQSSALYTFADVFIVADWNMLWWTHIKPIKTRLNSIHYMCVCLYFYQLTSNYKLHILAHLQLWPPGGAHQAVCGRCTVQEGGRCCQTYCCLLYRQWFWVENNWHRSLSTLTKTWGPKYGSDCLCQESAISFLKLSEHRAHWQKTVTLGLGVFSF